MLKVQPICGLANRMRALASARQIALELNVPLVCYWRVDAELGAPYSALFMPIEGVEMREAQQLKVFSSLSKRNRMVRFLTSKWNKWQAVDFCVKETDVQRLIGRGESIVDILKAHRDEHICLETYGLLGNVNDWTIFKPVSEIQEKIDAYLQNMPLGTYGIHIRRTDNEWAKEASPLILFRQKIGCILKKEPEAHFYLATDDEEIIADFRNEFGAHILTRDKSFSRTSVEGMQDAVVEMWILSRTKKIFGSYYSSYSEMASWVGSVDLEVLKK